jgi:hypothetical protein
MSVCDPSLRLPVKTNNSDNTLTESVEVIREIRLEGTWQVKNPLQVVTVSYQNGETVLEIKCRFGIPVEFEMQKIETATENIRVDNPLVYTDVNRVVIDGFPNSVKVFDVTGKVVGIKDFQSEKKSFLLNKHNLYLLIARLSDNTLFSHKFIL